MLDLDLLRSFVSVIDAGGFTRAGERVHRTQSTVSQQIRRLEETVGQSLLSRDGKRATPTEAGERLLSYARRMLSLAEEARDALARPIDATVRLGLPEDFTAYRLTEMLSNFARAHPQRRLNVRSDISIRLRRDLERGELDLALIKSRAGESGGIATWPETPRWVGSRAHTLDLTRGSIPIAAFDQGCVWRNSAVHALETAGRSWHVAYTSASLAGIQAAVAAGLGVSVLSEVSILPTHRMLGAGDGLPPIAATEVALIIGRHPSQAARELADLLIQFCSDDPRLAA